MRIASASIAAAVGLVVVVDLELDPVVVGSRVVIVTVTAGTCEPRVALERVEIGGVVEGVKVTMERPTAPRQLLRAEAKSARGGGWGMPGSGAGMGLGRGWARGRRERRRMVSWCMVVPVGGSTVVEDG